MDIGKAFGHVFEDEQWISKVLIGGLLLIIPIVNFAVFGYMMKLAQNVSQGNPRPLPEWGEFGEHFMRGLYWLVISVVYSLPVIILAVLFVCVFGGAASMIDSETGEGAGAAGGLVACFIPLMVIAGIGGAILSYVALARYIATNQLSEAFAFSAVIASLRSNLGDWLMLLLVAIIAGFVGSLGGIACGIGALFTTFYGQCVTGHALGQLVARQRLSAGGVSDPPVGYGPPPTY